MPPKKLLLGWNGHLETGREGRKVDEGAGSELRVVGEMHI